MSSSPGPGSRATASTARTGSISAPEAPGASPIRDTSIEAPEQPAPRSVVGDCGDFDSHCASGYTFMRGGTQVRSTADQQDKSHDYVYVLYDPSIPGTEVATAADCGDPPGQLVQVVADLASSSSSPQTTVANSPADNQYKPGKGCGDKNHEHERNAECKININDVKMNEGNAGLTSFTFTVSLDGPPIDPITVDWATADGTATALSDYVAVPATTTTFAVGVQALPVTVFVVGDTTKEKNETFYVNLSNPSPNAFIGDGQGLGTIVNDD